MRCSEVWIWVESYPHLCLSSQMMLFHSHEEPGRSWIWQLTNTFPRISSFALFQLLKPLNGPPSFLHSSRLPEGRECSWPPWSACECGLARRCSLSGALSSDHISWVTLDCRKYHSVLAEIPLFFPFLIFHRSSTSKTISKVQWK